MTLGNLVEDWGGFEKLVANLHDTGKVEVEHNATLIGNSGAPRQIDVVVRHREGFYEHLIIVECKYWKENVSRLHVDALKSAVEDLKASRGVIFSTKGFQEGAITAAKHAGIDLYKIRDLTAQEWGLPGRVIDFFIQIYQRAIGNVQPHGVLSIGTPQAPVHLNLEFAEEGAVTKTPTIRRDGLPDRTLEELLLSASSKALNEFTNTSFLLCNGDDCTRYMMGTVNFEPPDPILIPLGGAIIIIPKLSFDLGIKIRQFRIVHDRAEKLMFALAVEDCIRQGVSLASREKSVPHTILKAIKRDNLTDNVDLLENGSIMKVYMNGFFQIEEMANLTPVPFETRQRQS